MESGAGTMVSREEYTLQRQRCGAAGRLLACSRGNHAAVSALRKSALLHSVLQSPCGVDRDAAATVRERGGETCKRLLRRAS